MTRDADRCCAACLHWDEQIGAEQEIRWGYCRRNPPIAVLVEMSDGEMTPEALWPSTYPEDWCSAFGGKQ